MTTFPNKNLDTTKIRVNHLNNEEERNEVLKLCKEFSDIFYNEEDRLTFTNRIKHQIKTVDELPVYTKSYRYPFIHKQEVEKQIKEMLDQNIIRPSSSPWMRQFELFLFGLFQKNQTLPENKNGELW